MGEKKKGRNVRLGPDLIKELDLQIDRISDATYGVVRASYFDAGEIISKKIKGEI